MLPEGGVLGRLLDLLSFTTKEGTNFMFLHDNFFKMKILSRRNGRLQPGFEFSGVERRRALDEHEDLPLVLHAAVGG